MPNNLLSYSTIKKLFKKPACMPPIGLLTIAALLPQQWSFKIVDCMIREPNNTDWEGCDAVFISGMNIQEKGIIKVAPKNTPEKTSVMITTGRSILVPNFLFLSMMPPFIFHPKLLRSLV